MQILMDAEAIRRTLDRMAHELVERYYAELRQGLLVGIRTRGVPLAQRIGTRLRDIADVTLPLGILDITLYRDDLTQIGPAPLVRKTELPLASLHNRYVFLIDDVLYTGRTVRAALDALIDFGRPRAVRLVVLVDRDHRELPIQADIVGQYAPTPQDQIVHVMLEEVDGKDEVLVVPRPEAPPASD